MAKGTKARRMEKKRKRRRDAEGRNFVQMRFFLRINRVSCIYPSSTNAVFV